MNDTALLVIDSQVNMVTGDHAVYQSDLVLERVQHLIERARDAAVLVVYIQNNGQVGDPDEPQTAGWAIHPALVPRRNEPIIQKQMPSAFHRTSLHERLQARDIRQLVIVGFQTEMCIDTTVRHAYTLGYDVLLVRDAHSTFDSPVLPASAIIAHHNDILRVFADVVGTREVEF